MRQAVRHRAPCQGACRRARCGVGDGCRCVASRARRRVGRFRCGRGGRRPIRRAGCGWTVSTFAKAQRYKDFETINVEFPPLPACEEKPD